MHTTQNTTSTAIHGEHITTRITNTTQRITHDAQHTTTNAQCNMWGALSVVHCVWCALLLFDVCRVVYDGLCCVCAMCMRVW